MRAGNEYGATLMQQYPKRFGLMAGIPMPEIEGSLRQVEYAYDTLQVDAIGIYTNGGGPATRIRRSFRSSKSFSGPTIRLNRSSPPSINCLT